jgi:3-dehydroquinate synthase
MKRSLTIDLPAARTSYDVTFRFNSLAACGSWANKLLGRGGRSVAVVSDPTVFGLYGDSLIHSLENTGLRSNTHLIRGGERAKTLGTVERILSFLSTTKITRSDAVLALGGGVVGDLAGFAAATHLRGVKFLQVPTTLLAMVDAAVGGKTGVNSPFGKNLIGAFHQPAGVLVDPGVLETLPRRELTAGFSEAIKQAAVTSQELFDRTREFLSANPVATFGRHFDSPDLRSGLFDLIYAQIAAKGAIVAADPQESTGRKDAHSRKVLNFGHTLAHALEKVTNYQSLRHGEAVGYGILFAAELSKNLALCSQEDVESLNDVVHRAGKLPVLRNIDEGKVFEAFRSDKKHSAGSLQMVLIKGIGKPVIVPFELIPQNVFRRVLRKFLRTWAE